MDDMHLTVRSLTGADITPHLDDVARLRIGVFHDWPYLYAGDAGYEREYLAAYAASPESVFVLACDGDRVIGASTGVPLADAGEVFQVPFRERGIDVAGVFYFGESVLLQAYRGRGIGHAFFDSREAHARVLGGYTTTAFCAVDRDHHDPRRPRTYHGNEVFWRKRRYVRRPGMTVRLAWDEIGVGEIEHALTFWTRPLQAVPE